MSHVDVDRKLATWASASVAMNQVKEIVFVECDIAHVKRSNPEKNPRRYPEQKREPLYGIA
jgi:hypothetical protein